MADNVLDGTNTKKSNMPLLGKRRNAEGIDSVPEKKIRISILDKPKEYPASGLKHSLHGNIYQLKLLMLFLKRGLDKGYSFRLATEMDDAEKFDDLVFEYENEKKDGTVWRFLQAKHKQDESKKISVNDLLTEKDEEFSLQKYFISYRKIKQNLEFSGQNNELKDFVICTNIGLSDDLQNSFERVVDEENIFSLGEESKYLKFRINNFRDKENLISILENTSDLYRLAKKLVECVLNNKPLTLKDELFQSYHGILAKKVVDIENSERKESNTKGEIKRYAKFHNTFLDKNSKDLVNFRNIFLEAYRTMSKKQVDVDTFWEEMKTKEVQISKNFGKIFELDVNPQLTDLKEFTKDIVNTICKAQQDIVHIKREGGKRVSIVKENIDKLAGHVLIKRGNKEKDIYHFSSAFFDDKNQLPGNLENFRIELKIELESKGIRLNIDKYKFHIVNFQTCEEEQLYSKPNLPNDYIAKEEIESFFEKLVFAIGQPNEVNLGKIIEGEISESKDINLIDSEFIASKFQKDMLDWMKKKEGCFLTYEDGQVFFNEARQKISKLVLVGPILEYCVKVQNFGIEFKESWSELDNFLASQEKQIFNLASPYETILGSIRVYQTLRDILENQKDNSQIFMQLSSLLCIQDRVIEVFNSETSRLLVIECKATHKNIQQLYDQLSKIIQSKSNNNKKIILITQGNNVLADKFKRNFSQNNKYEEKQDKENSFTNLTPESQNKVLSEGKIIFQGEDVSLDTLIDESKHLVDAEVLSKLINNDKIEIGKALTDSKYDDVKDYYIDRTFIRHIKIKGSFKKDSKFFVIDNRQVNESNSQSNQDIVLISDRDNDFENLCNKYEKHNIHWLKNDLTWQQSHGSLSKLCEFVDTNEESIQEFKPKKFTDIPDRVAIIAAEPGMGKSTVLTFLALKIKESNPSLWVVRINLLDQKSRLDEWQKDKTEICESEALKFLYGALDFRVFRENGELKEKKKNHMINNIIKLVLVENIGEIAKNNEERKIEGLNLLEVRLFYDFYKRGKIALLFDGFDEISSGYKDQVIKLVEFLTGTKAEKIWVTTRPYNIQSELENKLGTFSYVLLPFLEKEQRRFLKKFWKKNLELNELDEQRSEVFIDELLHRFSESINHQEIRFSKSINHQEIRFSASSYDQEREFVGIPLQISMIAEIFQDMFKEFYDSKELELSDEYKEKLNEKLNLVTLYEKFVDKKIYKILFEEKSGMDTRNPLTKGIIELGYKKSIENHKKLAVYRMFEKLLSKQELEEEVPALIHEIQQGEEKTGIIDPISTNGGIIDGITNNGKPIFVHQTFGEYFASVYLWEKFKSIQFDKFEEFIKSIIIKNLINYNRIQICKFFQLKTQKDLENDVNITDKKDKLKMLLIKLVDETFGYFPFAEQPTKLLLKIIEFSLSAKEGSDLGMIEDIQNLTNDKKLELLTISAEMGYTKLANALGKKLKPEFLQRSLKCAEWLFSPLFLAAENGHLEIVRILVKKLYDTTWKDRDQMNLLQCIFEEDAFIVLRSCLKLGIVDVSNTYHNLNGTEELPLVRCIMKRAPSDVIELLIKKTDIRFINPFIFKKVPDVALIVGSLVGYSKNLLNLLVEKHIDLNANYEHYYVNITLLNPIVLEFCCNAMWVPQYFFGRWKFRRRIFFQSDQDFLKFFDMVKFLLESRAPSIYNTVIPNYGTPLQLLQETYYKRELLKEVTKLVQQKDYEIDKILDEVFYQILELRIGSRNKQSISDHENSQEFELRLPYHMLKFFFHILKKGKEKLNEVLHSSLDVLCDYKKKLQKTTWKSDGFLASDILDKLEAQNIDEEELLKRMLELYINQNYEIDEAFNEVSDELSKFKKIYSYVENPSKGVEQTSKVPISKELILQVANLENINFSLLNDVGKKNKMKVIEHMLQCSEQLPRTLELLRLIDEAFHAVETRNPDVGKILQCAKNSGFIKAAVNAHNKQGQTLLEFSYKHCNDEIINCIRSYGGNETPLPD